MDARSQEELNKILTKSPDELNDNEIGFLKARSGYLKKSQLAEYKSVLEEEKPPLYVAEKDKPNQTPAEAEPVKENATTEQTN